MSQDIQFACFRMKNYYIYYVLLIFLLPPSITSIRWRKIQILFFFYFYYRLLQGFDKNINPIFFCSWFMHPCISLCLFQIQKSK